MLIDETIANIERTTRHLKQNDPDYESQPPIVASPQWFADDVKELFADKLVEPTDEVAELGGVRFVIQTEITEPALISGKGAVYPVLPAWARAANMGARRSGEVTSQP